MPEKSDANQGEEAIGNSASATPPDGASLLRRVEYLEWLTGNMAADLAALRQNEPKAFRGRTDPASAGAATSAPLPATSQAISEPTGLPHSNVVVAPLLAASAPRAQSLESQLGSRVLSKVAIVLLLIGAAWFLKWAFDNRWIGPTGRVIIGLAAGIGVVLWSERFRRNGTPAFSYALKAVGSGVLYLSLWASFQLYHLVPSPVAFAAMVAVTAWNAFMAWSQDAELLASYALLGAYLTPALLSTGGDHEVFLFNYLLIIAASVVALLRFKPWSRLLIGVIPASAGFFIGWYAEFFQSEKSALTLFFALLFWAVFTAIPFLAREEGVLANVLAPIASATFGALTVYSVLADSARASQEAWWAVGFAAVYLVLTRVRSRAVVSAIHLSLGIVFLTVAIPLKATGHGITVGWLAEALALLWVASPTTVEPTARKLLRGLAYVSLALGVVGAMVGPAFIGGTPHPFFNRNFFTALGAIAVLLIAIGIELRQPASKESPQSKRAFAAAAVVAIEVLLLTAMYREIANYRLNHFSYPKIDELAGFSFSAWMMLQGAASLGLGFRLREPLLRWIGLILLSITVLKAFLYDMRELGTGYRVVSYLGLGVVLMGVSYAYQKDWLGMRQSIADTEDSGAHP